MISAEDETPFTRPTPPTRFSLADLALFNKDEALICYTIDPNMVGLPCYGKRY